MAEAKSSNAGAEGAQPDLVAGNQRQAVFVLGLIALQVLVYGTTYLSMAQVWSRSETFSHGFLIFPIAAWLVWRNRTELSRLSLAPDLRALVPLFVLVLGWAVWGDLPNALAWMGIGLLLGAGLYMLRRT